MKKTIMVKAVIDIIMVFCFCFFFTACSWLSPGQQITYTDKKTGTSITVSEDELKINGTIEFEDAKIEISEIKE